MPNLNKIFLIGAPSRDPVLMPANSPVAVLSLNVRRGFFDKLTRTRKEEFTVIDVATFGSNASSCVKRLKEGSAVFIEGYVKVDSWEHKATGALRSKLIVVADYVQFLNPGGERQENSAPAVRNGASVHAQEASSAK